MGRGTDSARPRNLPGFLVSIAVATLSLSTAYLYGSNGKPVMTFAAAVTGWVSYLFAHYCAEGEFVDGMPERARPAPVNSRLGVILGSSILVAGVVVGSVGVRTDAALPTHAGAALFVAGYMTAHYAATRELL